MKQVFLWILAMLCTFCFAEAQILQLRDNLGRSQSGDFLVTAQNRNYSVMAIQLVTPKHVVIEEITVPFKAVRAGEVNWKDWVLNGAPGNTCWVRYSIDLDTGQLIQETNQGRYKQMPPAANQFLTTLLTLPFEPIPLNERRRVGPSTGKGIPDKRPFWQPKLLVEGHSLEGVRLAPWWAKWPRDNSELSGRIIEVFLPEPGQNYPSYFPYWLEVSGISGRAKIRIVDSGKDLFIR